MNQGRNEDIEALRRLAMSADYRDRRTAAVGLANSAEAPAGSLLLRELVLDAEDTAVTLAASTALMTRSDRAGVSILATALTTADDQQADWIEAGIAEALRDSEESRHKAMALVGEVLEEAPDGAARGGLQRLLSLLRTAGLA